MDILTCSASSEYSGRFACEKAIDGNSDTSWATKRQGIGAWIQVNFGNVYQVEKIKIKHRTNNNQNEMFKDISLEFSDGTKDDYTLNNVHQDWNAVAIDKRPMSSFVKIMAKSVYGTINNGFSEIQIFGSLTGSS